MVVFALALATGIFLGFCLQAHILIQLACSVIAILLLLLRKHIVQQILGLRNWILPIVIFLTGIVYGNSLHVQVNYLQEEANINAVATVVDIQRTHYGYKSTLRIRGIEEKKLTYKQMNVMAFLPKMDYPELLPGDIIVLEGKFDKLPKPLNPNVFDYGRFLSRKNIQQICQVKLWRPTGNVFKGLLIHRLAYKIHIYCSDILDIYINIPQDASIVKGLLLGAKSDIPQETLQVFMSSGLMHLLSVSGYHVGLIFLILNTILSVVYRNRKNTQFSRTIICLIVIWMFALISGMSAAVVRAALLFSFLQIGKSIAKKTEILNLLALTAVLLLILNPQYLWDIGFQLSYMAMIGLIIAYPKIYTLIHAKNILADKLWQISAVAIAAMLLTTPLTIYYFGNFPTYFLLSNLYSGIVALVIIVFSIFLLLFAFIQLESLAIIFGKLIHWVVEYLFVVPTKWIVHLPAGSLNSLYINKLQCFILLISAILFIIFLYYRNSKWLYGTCCCIILTIVLSYNYTWQSMKLHELTFYSIKDKIYIGVKRGLQTDIITNDKDNFDKNYLYSILPSLRANHSRLEKIQYLEQKNYVLDLGGRKWAIILNNKHVSNRIPNKIKLEDKDVYCYTANTILNITQNGYVSWKINKP